jgi:hypothetical protein
MTKADQLVDRAADRLREFSDRAAAEGGMAAKLAEPLADDAAFLRKLKPSLIAARVRGQAPTNQPAGSGAPAAPTRPQLPDRPKKRKGGGATPFLIVGGALVAGIVIAKMIDWRGHAHPRD